MTASYEYYRIFYHVIRLKSLTKAAEYLMTNQPNITRSMNNLEAELGCRLMIRGHHGVELTPEGSAFYERIRVAVKEIEQAEKDLENLRHLDQGSLTLGVSEIAMQGFLLNMLPGFRKRYPGINLRIRSCTTPQALEALKMDALDLAAVTLSRPAEKIFTEHVTIPFQDVVAAAPEMAPQGETISIRDLTSIPFIGLGETTQSLPFFHAWAAEYGIQLYPDIEVSSTDQVLLLIRQGLGYGILPDFMTQQAAARGEVRILNLKEPLPQRHISLLTAAERSLSLAAGAFTEWIQHGDPDSGTCPSNGRKEGTA